MQFRAKLVTAALLAISLGSGVLVMAVVMIITAPAVSVFPSGSGAQGIFAIIAFLWGAVVAGAMAVFTVWPWQLRQTRQLRQRRAA